MRFSLAVPRSPRDYATKQASSVRLSIRLRGNDVTQTRSGRLVPEWLARLNPTQLEASAFPLNEALQHSRYYPAAGFDGRPVQFLGGLIHSFIYVDYGTEARAVDAEVQAPGFLGYPLVGSKRLIERDLAPKGWHPQVPSQFREQVCRFTEIQTRGFVRSPFATWYIFDRDNDRDKDHGPLRFSLVYLCADGVAAYQALYGQNHTAPEVLAVIQPGTGFGGNYTDFRDPDGFLLGRYCTEKAAASRNISFVAGFFWTTRGLSGRTIIQSTSSGFNT